MNLRKSFRKVVPENVRKAMGGGKNKKNNEVNVHKKTSLSKQEIIEGIPLDLQEKYGEALRQYKQSKNYKERSLSIQLLKQKHLFNNVTIKLRKKGQITTAMLVYIYKALEKSRNTLYVVTDSPEDKLPINYKNIKYVKPNSLDEVEVLMTSKIIITDGELPAYFNRQENQQVINLVNDFVYDLDEIERPIQKEKVRFQRILLHSSKIVVPVGVDYKKIFERFSIKTLYQGEIVTNFNALSEFNNIQNKNSNFFNIPTPWAIKNYVNQDKYKNIVLVDLTSEKTAKLSVDDLKKYIYTIQSKFHESLVLCRISARYFDYFYKNKGLRDYIIGAQRNIEPFMDQVSVVVSDSAEQLAQFNSSDTYQLTDNYLINFVEKIDYPEKVDQKYFDNKISILLYSGGMFNNGITSSILNLSNKIDYSKYSLTIIEKGTFDSSASENVKKLSTNVNLIQRWGIGAFDDFEQFIHDEINKGSGFQSWMNADKVFEMYQHELKRFLGTDSFDYSIDFGGYTSYYASMILAVNAQQKTIFLHNDMWKDSQRLIDGKYPNRATLLRVFTLYKFFDRLASVSNEVMHENIINLEQFALENKFVTVKNLINEEDIHHKLLTDTISEFVMNKQKYYLDFSEKLISASGVVLHDEIKIAPDDKKFTFIMAGRLSPEKAHKKMMDALRRVLNDGYTDVEVLILGDGPLKDNLIQYRDSYQLQHHVKFVGQVGNPYWYFKNSDSFLMTSDHEGQPMVLLEASVVGMPILATDIPGNRSVLSKTEGGVLVNNNVISLYEGMKKFIDNRHELALSSIDAVKYNKQTMDLFEQTVLPLEDK